MTSSFTLASSIVSVGDPDLGLVHLPLPGISPGDYRLVDGALVPAPDNAPSNTCFAIRGRHVFVIDALLGDRFTVKYREVAQQCGGQFEEICKRMPEIEKAVGTSIAYYRVLDIATHGPAKRYRLDPSCLIPAKGRFWRLAAMIGSVVLWLFGGLFAVLAIGCVVQHFVDPRAIWDRDPVRGVLEPISWVVYSLAASSAAWMLSNHKFVVATLCLIPIAIVVVVMGSMYGF